MTELTAERFLKRLMPNFYILFWKHEGTSFRSDDSFGHRLTVSGPVKQPGGRYFDGADDSISLPVASTDRLSMHAKDHTILVWFKFSESSYSTNRSLLFNGAGNTGLNQDGYWIRAAAANRFTGYFSDGTAERFSFSLYTVASFYDRKYHCAVFRFHRKSTLSVNIDGQPGTTTTDISSQPGDVLNQTSLKIGSTGSAMWFWGHLGEIATFNRLLTNRESEMYRKLSQWRYR